MGFICSLGFSFVRLRLGFIIWFHLFLLRLVFVWSLLWVSFGVLFVRLRLGFIIRFAWFSLFLLRRVFVWFHSFSFAASLFGFHYGFHRWLGAVSVSLDELL